MERKTIVLPEQMCRYPNPRNTGEDSFEFFLVNNLEKVFSDGPVEGAVEMVLYCAKGETPGVQLVYRYRPGYMQSYLKRAFLLEITGAPCPARVREVKLVPTDLPVSEEWDDRYLTTQPGLFPDLLEEWNGETIQPVHGQYRALWIDFPNTESCAAGTYEVKLRIHPKADSFVMGMYVRSDETQPQEQELTVCLHIANAVLPAQKPLHTEWFYTDCLADYYGVKVFSDRHFEIIDHFMEEAASLGVNVILTPVFTPPINTMPGGERTTTQLVGIQKENDSYTFDFALLRRWCGLCRKNGFTHLELPHLFTKWGAGAAPKIVAQVDGEEQKIFGWETEATNPDYRRFLEMFLPALRRELCQSGYDDEHLFFHISDEPNARVHWDSYCAAAAQVKDLLAGCTVMDAISDPVFYDKGITHHPIPTVDKASLFLEKGISDFWVYYCTAQAKDVPNRFFSMPSVRNRVLGLLMYSMDIQGFLHWGYNFYLTEYGDRCIDPYFDTSAGGAFQAGDSFLVYPGADGKPRSSIRAEVLRDAFTDIRLLEFLEAKIGRDKVLALLQKNLGYLPDFYQYPTRSEDFIQLHDQLIAAIVLCRVCSVESSGQSSQNTLPSSIRSRIFAHSSGVCLRSSSWLTESKVVFATLAGAFKSSGSSPSS